MRLRVHMAERLKRPSAKPAKSEQPVKRAPAQRRPRGNPNWVPGVSGNPSGREKLTEPARHAIYEAKHYSSEAINKLVGLMRCAASEAVQYQAACAILDRAWGRPAQAILSATMEIEPPDNEQLKGADLERLGDVYALMI